MSSFFTLQCVFCAGDEPPASDDEPTMQPRLVDNTDRTATDRTAEDAEIDGVYGQCGVLTGSKLPAPPSQNDQKSIFKVTPTRTAFASQDCAVNGR